MTWFGAHLQGAASGRDRGTDSGGGTRIYGVGWNVDSRTSKVVLIPYSLPYAPCIRAMFSFQRLGWGGNLRARSRALES